MLEKRGAWVPLRTGLSCAKRSTQHQGFFRRFGPDAIVGAGKSIFVSDVGTAMMLEKMERKIAGKLGGETSGGHKQELETTRIDESPGLSPLPA